MQCLILQGGGPKFLTSAAYSLAPKHFGDADLRYFRAAEKAYEDVGIKIRQVFKGGDVIIHLSTDKQIRSIYPELTKYPGLSLTDRGLKPMHIHLHLENWFTIPKHMGSEYTNLDDYRIALISHELSHVLGHDHVSCACKGCPSDVRQQPSRGLAGCLPTTQVVFHKNAPYSSVNF
jgi:hypothetical protein